MPDILNDLTDFLEKSPTSFHAVKEMEKRLHKGGFSQLHVDQPWKLKRGESYFVAQEGSLALFTLPKQKPEKMAILGAHTDSPALKIKPRPDTKNHNMHLLGVELYGSPIVSTWMNRDLAIAGRVFHQGKEQLIYLTDTPLFIPLLAPHLDREAHKKGFEFNVQELLPIAGLNGEGNFLESLFKKKPLDFDLFLVPMDPPRYMGKKQEMLASYRLDNLISVHAGLTAFLKTKKIPEKSLPIGLFWDHEEIGSSTHTGAESPFFKDIYARISHFYELEREEEIILRKRSLCLSIDVSHALNPNYEKKYDPNHLPLLGEGIVIKYHAGMRYATTAKTGSSVMQLCDKLKLKWQQFTNRADNPAGSTIGPIFSSSLGIETVDIGIPQLSMHAAREVIACQDHLDMCTLLQEFIK